VYVELVQGASKQIYLTISLKSYVRHQKTFYLYPPISLLDLRFSR